MSEVLFLSLWVLTVSISHYCTVFHAHAFGPCIYFHRIEGKIIVNANYRKIWYFCPDVTVPDSKEFKSLEGFVSEKTLNAISDMGFTTMMEIQHKSIVPLLKGRYIVVQKITILLQRTFHDAISGSPHNVVWGLVQKFHTTHICRAVSKISSCQVQIQGRAPLIFRPNWGPKGQKNFLETAPTPPPPAPPFSKGQFSSPYIMTLTGT